MGTYGSGVALLLFHYYRTIKQDCPATINLCLSEENQELFVSHVNLDHNHAVGKVGINLIVNVYVWVAYV